MRSPLVEARKVNERQIPQFCAAERVGPVSAREDNSSESETLREQHRLTQSLRSQGVLVGFPGNERAS